MKLSVIITSHNEGLLLHKAILSVQRALAKLDNESEIIINIDNGDEETLAYLANHKVQDQCRVRKTQFGDVGEARNAAIQDAKGEFVAFVDGDDLVSQNYFVEALEILENCETETVVHPEYCFTFTDTSGDSYTIQPMHDWGNPQTNAMILLGRNRWIVAIVGRRETFEKTPYLKNGNGFGHEDYILNIQLSERGVQHKIAKKTVYFYRRRDNSCVSIHNAAHRTQPYSSLFEIEKWKKFEVATDAAEMAKPSFKERAKDAYVKLRNHKIPNAIITPMANLAKKATGKKIVGVRTVPEDLLWLWKDIAEIEGQLYPTETMCERTGLYDADTNSRLGDYYRELCRQVDNLPDYVIISDVSDVTVLRGRVEKVHQLHPKWKIAVLVTKPAESLDLPEEAYVINLGEQLAKIDWIEDRYLLLTRLLVQLECAEIEILDDAFATDWAYTYRELVKAEFRLYMTLAKDIIEAKNARKLASLMRLDGLMKKIYVPDRNMAEKLVEIDGFSKEKIDVLDN